VESDDVRRAIADALLQRVAGPDPQAAYRAIHEVPGERWFGEDRVIRRVHGDASMFIGGIRALLLQSLHPLAMAGVAAHSGYRGDPWGRLQRTSSFIAVTTFGRAVDAEAAIARVRSIHERVKGTTTDGRVYAASDPHLLKWVHIAEIDSFLRAHQAYGAQPLDQAGRDAYIADTAKVAEKLGVLHAPISEAQLKIELGKYESELEGTSAAQDVAKYLLFENPLPAFVRGPYLALGAAAAAMLSSKQRGMLGLHKRWLPGVATAVEEGGEFVTSTIRWALTSPRS
jgi:uncharacterized protein (DUF2236 family)